MKVTISDSKTVNSFSVHSNFKRHGGAYDRGSADRYYGRPFNPHYFKGDSYSSERVEEKDMTFEELRAYKAGFDEETDRKNWN